MVHTVFKFENHELDTPVLDNTARFASSPACDRCAVNPCFAAMVIVACLRTILLGRSSLSTAIAPRVARLHYSALREPRGTQLGWLGTHWH